MEIFNGRKQRRAKLSSAKGELRAFLTQLHRGRTTMGDLRQVDRTAVEIGG
jgi:hypothetical protein